MSRDDMSETQCLTSSASAVFFPSEPSSPILTEPNITQMTLETQCSSVKYLQAKPSNGIWFKESKGTSKNKKIRLKPSS